MSLDVNRRPPIITDADRAWALAQQPGDWVARAPDLDWGQHVAEQIERFERHWQEGRKSAIEWSIMFRTEWWPKADPAILHPKTAPHVPHPFIRADHPEWSQVVAMLTPTEAAVARRFGVMTFRPDDPRVEALGAVLTAIHTRPGRATHPRRAA
jgi:hypothetical protein